MSDFIGHHCGVALVRLKKPLAELQRIHGDPLWGLRKLYLLMEKQHNRGQDGAGIASVKFDTAAGEPFLSRLRNSKRSPVTSVGVFCLEIGHPELIFLARFGTLR